MRIFIIFALSCLMTACAPFEPYKQDSHAVTYYNKAELAGKYHVFAIKDSGMSDRNIEFENAFEKFYRHYGRGTQYEYNFESRNQYSFQLDIIDSANIKVSYLKNDSTFRNIIVKYEIKPDGYLYINNRNFLMAGIPYIFGGIDIKKLRLTRDSGRNLIIEEVYHSSGALLLIFGDSKTWNTRHRYVKID
ncbi:MAG: hypothetical protein V4543_12030 [Bacteroidota bacterium]